MRQNLWWYANRLWWDKVWEQLSNSTVSKLKVWISESLSFCKKFAEFWWNLSEFWEILSFWKAQFWAKLPKIKPALAAWINLSITFDGIANLFIFTTNSCRLYIYVFYILDLKEMNEKWNLKNYISCLHLRTVQN